MPPNVGINPFDETAPPLDAETKRKRDAEAAEAVSHNTPINL